MPLSKKPVSGIRRRLFTRRQAAEYLGVSYRHLTRLLIEGEIPVVGGRKPWSKLYIDGSDMDHYIQRNKRKLGG